MTREGLCDYVWKYSFFHILYIATPWTGPMSWQIMHIMDIMFLTLQHSTFYPTYKNSFITLNDTVPKNFCQLFILSPTKPYRFSQKLQYSAQEEDELMELKIFPALIT